MKRCGFCFSVLFLIGLAFVFYIYILRDLPDIKQIKRGLKENPTRVYASDGVEIGQLSRIKGEYVSYSQIPSVLVKAVVATEDSKFFKHRGIDYAAIIRAFLKDLFYGSFREGGSTITQQLAKLAFLSREKTIKRKIKELIIALRLEKGLTKEEILELYLNRAYFGSGLYGVESAAEGYFGKHLKELNIKEAATLAGLLRSPEYYSPFRSPRRAEERARVVLKRMELVGYLKPSERKRAERIRLKINASPGSDEIYGYYLDVVKAYLIEKYGPNRTFNGGLRVYTTLRRWAQIKAVQTLKDELERLDRQYGWRGPVTHRNISVQNEFKGIQSGKLLKPFVGKRVKGLVLRVYADRAIVKVKGAYGVLRLSEAKWARRVYSRAGKRLIRGFNLKKILKPGDVILVKVKSVNANRAYLSLTQEPLLEGAIVSIKPQNGYVQALVGGYSYRRSQFNRSVSALRQAGSVFKPFVYALALMKGYSPDSVINDTPVAYKTGDGRLWRPMNYDKKFHGRVTLREALMQSLNVATVRLAEAVGINDIVAIAKRAELGKDIPRDLSLALGTVSTSPLKLATAYTAFANNGVIHTPLFIKEVLTEDGRVLEKNRSSSRRLFPPQTAYTVTEMLVDVVREGTGRLASGLATGVAGKTGTTDGYRDAWFVGFTPELVTVVWVGFDDNRSLGTGMSGGRVSAPLWKRYMRNLIAKGEKITFNPPENVVKLKNKKRTMEDVFKRLLWDKED
ncbi:MAG: PBP1A family penicillin-binding protein [Nitrospirae bacterium]|nr:MAG: PBP1A family penicillin-binding protein [Nitrospirota bacterium]